MKKAKVKQSEEQEILNEINTPVVENTPVEEVKKEIVLTPKKQMKVLNPTDVKAVPDESFEVYNLVKEGYTYPEIKVMYPSWSAKKLKAIQKRVSELMAYNVAEMENAKAEAITKYQDLYRKAYKIGNIKECKNILDSLTKVQGLTREINIQADFTTVWR